jgi:hypothetical protein
MQEINIGDLLYTKIWFGIVVGIDDLGWHKVEGYYVHWFFNDDRKPVSYHDPKQVLIYKNLALNL